MNDDSIVPGEKRRGTRRRARTKADILSAAREVFAARGYHDASIAEIAERADVAVGTFYLYFRDKDEAFTALLHEGFSETREQVIEAMARQSRTLPVVIRAIFRYAYEQRSLFRIALTGSGQFTRIARVQTTIAELITSVLEKANEQEALSGYDLPTLTCFLTGMITQGIESWFEHDVPDPTSMANQLLYLLQHGLPEHVFTENEQ